MGPHSRPAMLTDGAAAATDAKKAMVFDAANELFPGLYNSQGGHPELQFLSPENATFRDAAHLDKVLTTVMNSFNTVNTNYHRSGQGTTGIASEQQTMEEIGADASDDDDEDSDAAK